LRDRTPQLPAAGSRPLSAAHVLAIYRATFVALILIASVQALFAGHEGGHNIAPLAATEIAAAAALLWRRTQVPGACLLLAVFALAQVLSALDGRGPTHFLQYAASTVLIVVMDRALRVAPHPSP
jgi:Cu/Ag efflux pump CusA